MKIAKRLFSTRKTSLPKLRFEKQNLSSYAGLVVFHDLVRELGRALKGCRVNDAPERHTSYGLLFRLLVVHSLMGMRKLREVDFYREDPLVCRVLGVEALPSVSTISRMLDEADEGCAQSLRAHNRQSVLRRLGEEQLRTLCLDFDGSVISTTRKAEGTAAGYNKKKGRRSYYPLFCMVSQTGQVLDVLHRSGNVHDSNGAVEFVRECLEQVQAVLPRARLEVRMDSAFFSEAMIAQLIALKVDYAISVPFERFCELKSFIEQNHSWKALEGKTQDAFERYWKPKRWEKQARFVFVRSCNPKQSRGALQLDLFEPRDYEYDYKCIVTNKTNAMRKVTRFIEGRCQQENTFSELKDQGSLDYIPSRRQAGNRCYMLCALIAHNLARELQMRTWQRLRSTNEKRSPLWVFEKIQTLRNNFICKAARITRTAGTLTLTLNKNHKVEMALRNYIAHCC